MFRFKYISNGMMAALTLSVIIAFMISLIPSISILKVDEEFPVFRQNEEITLTDQNIVNFISSFSVEIPIKKVTWKHDILSIDFLIDRNSNVNTNIIYEDLYTSIQKGFVQGKNVKEVLLRVFLDDMDKIFVAVSAQKKDIANNPTMEIDSNMMYKDFLEQYFGLNYGNLIKRD